MKYLVMRVIIKKLAINTITNGFVILMKKTFNFGKKCVSTRPIRHGMTVDNKFKTKREKGIVILVLSDKV
jgi:hypothetical protein